MPASVTLAYDNLGNRTSLTRGNGTVTSYAYDPAARLTSFTHDLSGTAQDVTSSFTYNPASQIASRTRSNDAFAWSQAVAVNRAYANNGLNQHTQSGAVALGYDGRGNLTGSGATTYLYTAENRLATVSDSGGSRLFSYDALGRLAWTQGAALTYFEYEGTQVTRELSATVVLRRYVYGPGTDEPLVWYEGADTADRRWLHADERGSVIAVTNASGASIAVNSYDDYGIPASSNLGRFQYTGQAWIPELGMYYYKARMYSPTLGRFMQTDPIGYGDGLNVYNYVGGDPVNFSDPSGLGAASRDVDFKRIIPIDCPTGFICVQAYDAPDAPPRGLGFLCVQAYDAPDAPPRGLGFLLSANRPGDRGTPNLGERNDGGDNGPPGDGPGNAPPEMPKCPPPTNVNFRATLITTPAGIGYISGTLTNVGNGQTISFQQLGISGGFVLGSYSFSGTVRGFASLSNGFDITFALGPFGSSRSSISNNNGDTIGQIDLSGGVSPPLGVGVASFAAPPLTVTDNGPC